MITVGCTFPKCSYCNCSITTLASSSTYKSNKHSVLSKWVTVTKHMPCWSGISVRSSCPYSFSRWISSFCIRCIHSVTIRRSIPSYGDCTWCYFWYSEILDYNKIQRLMDIIGYHNNSWSTWQNTYIFAHATGFTYWFFNIIQMHKHLYEVIKTADW